MLARGGVPEFFQDALFVYGFSLPSVPLAREAVNHPLCGSLGLP